MQGLITNLTPNLTSGLNASDNASQSANGLNSAINGASGDKQASLPLFSNLLSSATHTEQAKFQSQTLNAFETETLPLERQLLPHSVTLGLTNRSVSGSLNISGQNDGSTEQALAAEGELLDDFNASKQAFMTPVVVADNVSRPQDLAGQMAASGTVAAQVGSHGQKNLQQDLMMRQLSAAPGEITDSELTASRFAPQLENGAMVGNGAQLSNLLRDAMLLKQQSTGGSESKISDSISSSTLGNLTTLSGEAKGSGESKSLMQASINTPFSQQAGWGEEMASRVKWMVNSQVQSAELKMNPSHLGPVEVKISVQSDQTTIHFSAQNGAVREALDSAMPRLREMLADNGVNLADVDVSDQSFAQQQKMFEQGRDAAGDEYASGEEPDDGEVEDTMMSDEGEMLLSSKIVDYYA
ncbi:hypothetical protein MNBD_GAMMA17-1230 [hydrothermal vent metagenome]|uniref:Flagellar hook-length control protein-like C-terminal domain-containing protein n=1 Tax=hydrothermal vent metagenome TaxID=652676 RepID=A0A3B0Z751_9ZZZZ